MSSAPNLRAGALGVGVLAMVAAVFAGCGGSSTDSRNDAAADAGGDVPRGPARATFLDTPLDFGLQDCGGGPVPSQALLLFNSGGTALTWTASLGATSLFSISGAAGGTLAAGDYTAIAVTAKAVPTSAHAGDVLQAVLTITTSDPTRASTAVPVRMTAQGATLDVLPSVADFGQFPLGAQAPDIPITIANSGNAAVQVRLGSPQSPDLTATWTGAPAAGSVAPGGSLAGAALRFTPTSTNAVTDVSAVSVVGAVCGALPAPIPVKGQGTHGVAGASPGTLDFGLVSCGATAASQTLTLTNAGNGGFAFMTQLAQASAYVVSPASGAVPPNSQVQLTVTPKAVPKSSAVTPNLYGDTLTITTTAQGDTPHVVTLRETARGAILSVPGPVLFGRVRIGTGSAVETLTIKNSGNAPATVAIDATGSFTGGSATVPASGSATTTATYTPDPAKLGDLDNAVLTFSTSDVQCGALPVSALTGTSYDRATRISAGKNHTCVIATSGLTYCWGLGGSGELGDGASVSWRPYPGPVQQLANALALGLGGDHSCALVQGGSVRCWGDGSGGMLGDGTTNNSNVPVAVAGLNDAAFVAGAQWDTYAVRANGSVMAWGFNGWGQLGNGTFNTSYTPVAVTGITDAKLVAPQQVAACALHATGRVSCWGDNVDGNLGNGTKTQSPTPVDVLNLNDAVALSGNMGGNQTCALRAGGAVVCWGDNFYGQLGNGTTTQSTVPVAATGLTDATALAGGWLHTCAVRTGGSAVCWGYNGGHALGDGTYTPSSVPVAVVGVTSAVSIVAGWMHACVLNQDGTVFCWGDNGFGELGDRTLSIHTTGVSVSGFD